MQSKYFPVRLLWKYQTLLFVHCNIPQGVFCERRSPTEPATGSFLRMQCSSEWLHVVCVFDLTSKETGGKCIPPVVPS